MLFLRNFKPVLLSLRKADNSYDKPVTIVEENVNLPEGFFDLDKFLIDKDIANPFQEHPSGAPVETYPYEDKHTRGYIRYVIQGRAMIILDCVVTERKG